MGDVEIHVETLTCQTKKESKRRAAVELLIELRADARGRKDFETGDNIRDRLTEMGITLEDRKEGTLWRIE